MNKDDQKLFDAVDNTIKRLLAICNDILVRMPGSKELPEIDWGELTAVWETLKSERK